MNGLDTSLEGLSRAQAAFDQAADNIARSPSANPQNPQDQVSVSDEMVALLNSRNDYEANLKSLDAGKELQKKLLDLIG